MKKPASIALAATLAVLAAGDWFVASVPADGGNPAGVPFGAARLTAALRDLEKDGTKESHLILRIDGDGRGVVQVRLQETRSDFRSRNEPEPVVIWTRDVALDSKKALEADLGAVPPSEPLIQRVVRVSTDGKAFQRLLSYGGRGY